jgi:hypothetical protein
MEGTMFLITILAIAVIILLIERNSIKNALTGIEYFQKPSLKIVEPDEEFDIICVLKNRTRRFISYLKLQEKFSKEIVVLKKINDLDFMVIESSQYLMPRQVLERRIRASIPRRGRYFLYGATIYGGDFLGITETIGNYTDIEEVIVIPRETTVSDVDVKLSGYIGEMSINRFIFEDPILTVGFNDYTGQEPQKMISWTQTARVGHLMVKKYDYTLELMVTVILNIDYNGYKHDEVVEECFSIARSVCQFLESRNIKYKVITNAITAGTKPIFENLDYFSWGRNHLMTILEGLGRANKDVIRESYNKLINRAIDSADSGIGHILITADDEDVYLHSEVGYMTGLEKLRELTGHEVCILNPNVDFTNTEEGD